MAHIVLHKGEQNPLLVGKDTSRDLGRKVILDCDTDRSVGIS